MLESLHLEITKAQCRTRDLRWAADFENFFSGVRCSQFEIEATEVCHCEVTIDRGHCLDPDGFMASSSEAGRLRKQDL